jgi:Cytochrome oxidase complex assembly protein 1
MPNPPYPLHPEPMRRSWIERNPLWQIPLGFLTVVLLMGLFGIAVIALISTTFRHSDVYQQAMVRAGSNLQVREQVGDPIHAGWIIVRELKLKGETGSANFSIPVSGPLERAGFVWWPKSAACGDSPAYRFTSRAGRGPSTCSRFSLQSNGSIDLPPCGLRHLNRHSPCNRLK